MLHSWSQQLLARWQLARANQQLRRRGQQRHEDGHDRLGNRCRGARRWRRAAPAQRGWQQRKNNRARLFCESVARPWLGRTFGHLLRKKATPHASIGARVPTAAWRVISLNTLSERTFHVTRNRPDY